ncbi:MAG TPA: amino acid adenylation domain-containing protein, partial [Thermoanaerobaculia bacterium]|nr:amino acid adenylation domain-containing protein [Thermoanaerobaculia bacterium]
GDAVLFAVHHIAADFWSLGLLARQLGELLSGREIGPAPSYSDFVAWQEAMLAGEEGERLERYWSERLQGLPALNLPVDRPRPASSGERGACRWRDLDPGLAEALKEVARSRGATLYAVLLTAFQTLLSRLSGQEDLAVGSPVAARPQGLPGAAETVGYFVNPVVLRADLSGEPSFLELLDRTRRVVLGALDHQGYPLPLLAERLRISSGKDALFRAMLVLHRPPFGLEELAGFALGEGGARLRLGGLDLESLPLAPRAAQFDLTLSAAERRGGLSLALVYDAGLFDEATADRWLGSLETLLRGIAARPQTPALDLPLLSSEERQQILAEAGADVEAPWRTLHEGFARQVEETPDRIALVWGGQRLSYAELGRRAGELAGRLRGLGAGPERIVGVRLPRTPELIVALLGVLESGAAYLPLDPAYPEERVRMMIEDAGAMATVMPRSMRIHTRARLSPGSGGGRKLAYLIYTSGSTGRPKAVAVEHASAVRLVAWARTVYQEDELAGVLASTSISFDLSVFEVFVPLLQGGTVILADDALALPGLPAAVTLVNTVPSAMAALLDMGPLPASVKTVNLAGEPLRQALAERVYAAGVERLWNLYGPSEDTTYSTGEVVRKGCEPGIGRAVAGSRAYVLDRGLRLQPVGIPGELCLGGGGLARGYLRRPALTAEKWVPDPFSEEPGARLYRTGDLARWRDGGLEYLGRLDRQVKVRGFRIEPGEIEATLLTHPAVRDAAVLAHKGSLAAFVVPADPGLREWLREKLPAQLVPDRFVALERLPLTPNGKVDRAALVLLAAARPSGGTEPPRGPAEERLAAIWAEVLGVETVGREDRFFDLGGHSLLATRVVSRISRSFGVELPLSTFFEEPTLAGLARRIEAARAISTAPIPRLPRTGDLPVSFAQERLWFLDQLEPGSPAYNMAGALRLHGDLDVARLGAALREIVRRHEVLRTTFQSREGRPYAVLSPVSESPLTLIDLSLIATPPSLEVEEALRPFDLARGPLFRATLVRLDPQDHLLLVTLHHTVADGWSVGLLARELATLYEGVPLAELPVQYADFAAWQRQQLSGDALAAQLRYWTGHLAGLDPAFDLPADRPRPPIASGRAGVERLLLSSGADLERLARQHGATLFMALLAGFETLLLRLTGRDDLAVGTPIANRTRVETEPLIGLFANTLVLRGDLAGDPSFAALLARVRETTLGAYAHQDLPFEKLVEALAPERALAHTPLFQVVFALQNTPRPEWRLPGLDTGPLEVGGGIAKFDLVLFIEPGSQGLDATLEYSRDLFDAPTARRLLTWLETLLAGAAANPERRLSDLPLLSESERRQLVEWNDTAASYPRDRTLPELFGEQVERRPEAVAVVAASLQLTYGELARRAKDLAAHLRHLGVGPEVPVAITLGRSPEMLISILAVLEAGGVYVPLDPAYPEERRNWMLEDSGAALLLDGFNVGEGLAPSRAGASPAPTSISAGSAAYLMYTSGSTGLPKAVTVPHRAVARLVLSNNYARFGPDETWAQLAPASFDASTLEIWGALIHGSRLVLLPPGPLSPHELGEELIRHQVTSLWLTAG